MREYLTKNEMQQLITVRKTLEYIKEVFEEKYSTNGVISKGELRYIRMGYSFLYKVVKRVIQSLDRKNQQEYALNMEKTSVMIAPTKDMQRTLEKLRENHSMGILLDYALTNCNPCNCDIPKMCELRIMLDACEYPSPHDGIPPEEWTTEETAAYNKCKYNTGINYRELIKKNKGA